MKTVVALDASQSRPVESKDQHTGEAKSRSCPWAVNLPVVEILGKAPPPTFIPDPDQSHKNHPARNLYV
ncbi:hypothetical protein E3N88_01122 [Mikania micrantha]|uniref:Uncharacterized protein n=1 Tax=Mikania micrantha TaxID=192012 RepID=A0A5N6Q1S5_9ASTR|nr:hypothetical protein E3N88_01122 [Mikania micrantha]